MQFKYKFEFTGDYGDDVDNTNFTLDYHTTDPTVDVPITQFLNYLRVAGFYVRTDIEMSDVVDLISDGIIIRNPDR